jgi:MoxR-vWA-beta-propeller ternary system domain bpX4
MIVRLNNNCIRFKQLYSLLLASIKKKAIMKFPFLKMIQQLRTYEEVILYGNVLKSSEAELKEVLQFLQQEYTKEAIDYPCQAPVFDADAALWGAATVHTAAQLMLYREHKPLELNSLLPAYALPITAAAILSADLCLRFLPKIMIELKMIDSEDALHPILEAIANTWSYAAIAVNTDMKLVNETVLANNECYKQLYAQRVVHFKKLNQLQIPIVQQTIKNNMGIYTNVFWKEAKIEE